LYELVAFGRGFTQEATMGKWKHW